jgi:hypothetical protein
MGPPASQAVVPGGRRRCEHLQPGFPATDGTSPAEWRQDRFQPTVSPWREPSASASTGPARSATGGVGTSATARAFGAEVDVEPPPRGLYLVVGRHGMPDAAIRSVGGEVMVRMEERDSVLAILAVDTHLALQHHPDVALAGPVTIDPERFARFVALAGLDRDRPPTNPH